MQSNQPTISRTVYEDVVRPIRESVEEAKGQAKVLSAWCLALALSTRNRKHIITAEKYCGVVLEGVARAASACTSLVRARSTRAQTQCRTVTRTRHTRASRSHRVGTAVAKSSSGDSGDGDGEPAEPPGSWHSSPACYRDEERGALALAERDTVNRALFADLRERWPESIWSLTLGLPTEPIRDLRDPRGGR